MDRHESGIEEWSQVRIGDAERDACMATLTEHHVLGRLTVEELDRRHRAALAGVTQADLAELVTDLPGGASTRGPVRHGEDWWALDPTVRAMRWARWAATPVALATGGVLVASTNNPSDESAFAAGLAAAALGYVTHWVTTKWHPGEER
jgi:hypothetical protein